MTIIPAIDILDGMCVRLTKGDYSTGKVYFEDPLAVALRFNEYGITRIHVVDLNGADSDHIVNREILKRICRETTMTVDFGGGIKSERDIDSALECGASMVTVGSLAAASPETVHEWIGRYGADKIILGADSRNGKIAIKGWRENSGLDIFDFISDYRSHGISRVICTDINRDGTLEGPAIDLYKEILLRFPGLKLTASGGVSSIDDLKKLTEAGLDSAIVGKAYYEGRITIEELKAINDNR
ncbi:MAG: 1-(5-phosphoribosyl)-5-[(5-phosphoribosylamino)methylideneamino]imidazole-4-carboxamide isomerase [Bacteroidaceae bacterium]|nr:1-(5-phosphoribosyl)-5-[(5-phosphoribosylamino)methylideneamino]imidazole-4-carboxamide isomerase [Bacteroidaceae bacterium]